MATIDKHGINNQHEDRAGKDRRQFELRTAPCRIHSKPQITFGHLQKQRGAIQNSQISDLEFPFYNTITENKSEIIEGKPSKACVSPEEFNVFTQLNFTKNRDVLEKDY